MDFHPFLPTPPQELNFRTFKKKIISKSFSSCPLSNFKITSFRKRWDKEAMNWGFMKTVHSLSRIHKITFPLHTGITL